MGGFKGDAHDLIKILRDAEVFGDLAHEEFRLGAGDGQIDALLLQRLQQRRDAGVHPVFLPADGAVAHAVDLGGLPRGIFIHVPVLHEGGDQRRADEGIQLRLAGHGKSQLLEGVGGAAGDAQAGFGDGAVKIKQYGVVFQ